MPRLEVTVRNEHSFDTIIPNTASDPRALAVQYQEALMQAEQSKTEMLCFENIPFVEKKSTNFQNILILERCIMEFLREHDFPKKVRIICESREVAELYKVVYNFYFPATKADRLDDDKWD